MTVKKDVIAWSWYDLQVKQLKKIIVKDGFTPDVVVGIMRGGVIPAIMLSHQFDVPCESVLLSYRDSQGDSQINVVSAILRLYSNVLIVEDIVDSGKTMSELKKFIDNDLSCYYPKDKKPLPTIKYASVWYNVSQPVSVDYHAVTFDRNKNHDWFVFPWEKQ